MLMMKRTCSLGLALLLAGTATWAQRRRAPAPQKPPARIVRTDTVIKSTTLEVYQQYEPELKPITKPELSPTLPPSPATRSPQRYEVPQQTLYYSYRALPLRPLALGNDTGVNSEANYVLLGGGNLSTIMGEVGIGSLRGANWQSALYGRYITQEGNISGQVFRSLKLRGDASLRGDQHLFNAGIDFSRNVFGRYGYDHDVTRHEFDAIKTAYTAAGISLGARNAQPGPFGFDYNPQVSLGYFRGLNVNEYSGSILFPVRKRLDSFLSVNFGINAWLTNTSIGGSSASNNLAQLATGLTYARNAFTGHLGLYPTFGLGRSFQVLPDITASYRFAEGRVAVEAGWQVKRIRNTVQELTTTNPFYTPQLHWQQTQRNEVFGGLTLAMGRHLSVWGRAGWQQFDRLPLFVTVFGGDGKDFTVLYDNVKAIAWSGGLRYAIGENLSLGASGAWFNFYGHSYSRVWGEPGVRLKGDATLRIVRDLRITAYAEVLDQIWGRDAAHRELKLKGVFDIGAAAEYSLVRRFSLFLRAENLLGRRNERWLGYPSFGFNIYGGARFLF